MKSYETWILFDTLLFFSGREHRLKAVFKDCDKPYYNNRAYDRDYVRNLLHLLSIDIIFPSGMMS